MMYFIQAHFDGFFLGSLQAQCLRYFRDVILELQPKQTTVPMFFSFIQGHHVQVTGNNINRVFCIPKLC